METRRNPWRPDPADERTPIGPPDTSMARGRRILPIGPRVGFFAEAQLLEDREDDLRVGFAHGAPRDFTRLDQQFFDSFMFFVHTWIVGRLGRAGYSYLPSP